MANFTSNTYTLKRKILTFSNKFQNSFPSLIVNLQQISLMVC